MPAKQYASQVWTLEDGGDGFYQIVNKSSGKTLNVPWASVEKGITIQQWNKENSNNSRWKIEEVGDGFCKIIPKLVDTFALNIEANSKDRGANIIQWTYEGNDNEKWEFKEVSNINDNPGLQDVSSKEIRTATDAWIGKFLYTYQKNGITMAKMSNTWGFWVDAEILETLIDAYEKLGDEKYLTYAKQFYEGFIDANTDYWTGNHYNDDILWASLAAIRLYQNTGDSKYYEVAKKNIEWEYNTQWDDVLGGGLWWKNTDRGSKPTKNTCLKDWAAWNCSAAVAWLLGTTVISGTNGNGDGSADTDKKWNVSSPDSNTQINVQLENGTLYYSVSQNNQLVVEKSPLGMNTNVGDFTSGLLFDKVRTKTINETYSTYSVKKSKYTNHCNEKTISFVKNNVEFSVTARAYNDGIAFRYNINTKNNSEISINKNNEKTGIVIPSNSVIWQMPYKNNFMYEGYFEENNIDSLGVGARLSMPMLYRKNNEILVIGILLLTVAGVLLGFNLIEGEMAGKKSEIVVKELEAFIEEQNEDNSKAESTTDKLVPDGTSYTYDGYLGILDIGDLNIKLPIKSDYSYDALKYSACRYAGNVKDSNMIICAHNYNKHLGKLVSIKMGTLINFTDISGRTSHYTVTGCEEIEAGDVERMLDKKSSDWDLTLFTCTLSGKKRYTVRCSLLN